MIQPSSSNQPEQRNEVHNGGTPVEKEHTGSEDNNGGDDKDKHKEVERVVRLISPLSPLVNYFMLVLIVAAVFLLSFLALQMQMKDSACKLVTANALRRRLEPALESAQNVAKLQKNLCKYYHEHYSQVSLIPWSNEAATTPVTDVYIKQTFHSNTLNMESDDIFNFFNWDLASPTRSILLEAEQGQGKSTAIKQRTNAWCNEIERDEYNDILQAKYIWDHVPALLSEMFIQEENYNCVPSSLGQRIPPWIIKMIEFDYLHYLAELFMVEYNIEDIRPWQCTDESEKSFLDCMQEQKPKHLALIDSTPILVLAFEYIDLCGGQSLSSLILKRVENAVSKDLVDEFLRKGSNSIFLAFDGYDEEYYHCKGKGLMEEANRIVRQQDFYPFKKFNMIVTTRPWKSSTLLNAGIGYQSMTMEQTMSRNEMDKFIMNFFKHSKKDLGSGLIDALNSPQNIIPQYLQQNKRILLYICHIWEFSKMKNDANIFFVKSKFVDRLWELMMWTHNTKYPERQISEEDLADIRMKMGEIEEHEMNAQEVESKFGHTVNLFHVGIYTKSIRDNVLAEKYCCDSIYTKCIKVTLKFMVSVKNV